MAAPVDAPAAGLLNLEKELVCFICTEVLFQPLTLIDCLHTFCGSCLKEWFTHQHKKAKQSRSQPTSNPYTCPTCRATVKDARHNATVTTLLDMFLTANPSRGRADDEKEEMKAAYTPGEDILPKIETRRRDRRERHHDEAAEAHDRRMIDEARERSLRDTRGGQAEERLAAPHGHHEHSRSRDREDRRRREQDRAERADRRRRAEASETGSAPRIAERPSGSTNATTSPLLPTRHPDAVEARQRERTIEHQSSLRSLVSASEGSTGTGDSLSEARIMQEIIAEGLLEGINVDELTEAEQDTLSERIAELYRQRHPRPPPQPSPPSAGDSRAGMTVAGALSEPSEGRRRQRSRDNQRPSQQVSRSTAQEAISQPRPRISDSTDNLSPPSERRAHRRRASDESRRQTSPSRTSVRVTATETTQNPGTRSATDLSTVPRGTEAPPPERSRGLSDTRRTNTEPVQSSPRASEVWRQQGGAPDGTRLQASSRRRTDSPSRPPQAGESPRPRMAKIQSAAEHPPLAVRPVPSELRSEPLPTLASTSNQLPSIPPVQIPTHFDEPSISCARCSRPSIQYEAHRHCSQCNMDLCRRCYRAGRGCNHWFGFGRAAMVKFEGSAPKRSSKLLEPPHVLIGRQYQSPAQGSVTATENGHATATTSDPAGRLQEGHFCDRCGVFANACFWSCEHCNEGEWGFCNECVDTHHCCTHPLLPISRRQLNSPVVQTSPENDVRPNQATLTPSDVPLGMVRTTPNNSRPSTSHSSTNGQDELSDFSPLKVSSHCDLCGQNIPFSHSRFHCPSHSSSTEEHNLGGYDVCAVCYNNLSRSGRIKRDDGPGGWRKCLSGHRMIVVVFEVDSQGNQRRVIVNDLVGGWKCTDEDMAAWKSNSAASAVADPTQSPPLGAGKWSWREDSTGKRATRARTSTLVSQPHALAFPPDGGFGKRCLGLWTYQPEEGDGGKGELLFPKGAEVREVEDVNGEWWDGVYMGDIGVFPAAYVRERGVSIMS